MAQFNGMVVTNKGRELLARALASKGKFIITAAALGAGAYSGKLRECEELVNKKLDLILLGVYSEKGSTKITVGITNKNVSESFRTNEIGVYAKLEGDTESVLYAYDVAVEADTMPNNSLGTTLELVYDIYFDVSSEVEVTLEITDSIAFLTQDIAKREFLKTYIVSGGDLKGKVQLEADKQYLADDGKWYQNIGGDRVWEKSGVPDELLIEISWKTIMDEIAKKENKILVKNTAFNKNFGTAENEVLEGIQLARTLGLEYGGELNNSNTKKLNTVYYDTQNKSFFKCFRENTLNYADSSYYEGISNNDLLLKLQNLPKISTRSYGDHTSSFNGFIKELGIFTYQSIPNIPLGKHEVKYTAPIGFIILCAWVNWKDNIKVNSYIGLDYERDDTSITVAYHAENGSMSYSVTLLCAKI